MSLPQSLLTHAMLNQVRDRMLEIVEQIERERAAALLQKSWRSAKLVTRVRLPTPAFLPPLQQCCSELLLVSCIAYCLCDQSAGLE